MIYHTRDRLPFENLTHKVCRVGGIGQPVIVKTHSDPACSNHATAFNIDDAGNECGEPLHGYVGAGNGFLDLRPAPGWAVIVRYEDGREVSRRAERFAVKIESRAHAVGDVWKFGLGTSAEYVVEGVDSSDCIRFRHSKTWAPAAEWERMGFARVRYATDGDAR
jgi:hypothetical protein